MNLEKYYITRDEAIFVIVDIQSRLLPSMSKREEVLENSKILTEVCVQMDIPVVVTEHYSKGLGKTIDDISESLLEETSVFEKIDFSACSKEFSEFLYKKNKKKVIIGGLEAHICIYQTVRDLLRDGYDVFVVRDIMSSRSKENYTNALDLMREMGAVIVNTETIVFDLLKTAGTDEFKKISKLIK